MSFGYHWKREDQQRWAEERLFRFLRGHVDRYHPRYRGVFRELSVDTDRIFGYEDFRRIPLTCRKDLAAGAPSFILRPGEKGGGDETAPLTAWNHWSFAARAFTSRYIRDLYGRPRSFREKSRQASLYEWMPALFTFSSGTTGSPVEVALSLFDVRERWSQVAGMFYASGWESHMRVLNLASAAPNLHFLAPVVASLTLDTGAAALHPCGWGGVPVERQVALAAELGCDVAWSRTDEVIPWLDKALELMERGTVDGLPRLRTVVAGGEAVSGELREQVRERLERLGAREPRILEAYGMAEMKACFCECEEGRGIHLNPEFFYWELLDPDTLKPVEWGEPGILVFSHVDWRGTVLLRYWTGDLVRGGMVWDKCPSCGLTLPRLFPPVVRTDTALPEGAGGLPG